MRTVVDHLQQTDSRRAGRRGAIFVTALGVIAVMVGMVLVFAQEMRTEALATKNRSSALQAAMIEQGGEQWVLAQIEAASVGDAVSITQLPAEQIQVGDGYFWILRPDPTSDQNYAFGITDEGSKLNINAAAPAQLKLLPSMTDEASDAMIDWRDSDDAPQPNGAESDFYGGLSPQGYVAKNYRFESIEELLLVKGCTPTLLYGYDLNRDGVLDSSETANGGPATSFNSATGDSRGLIHYITIYSTEPNLDSSGKQRIDLTQNGNSGALSKFLGNVLPKAQANAVMAKWSSQVKAAGATKGKKAVVPYENVLDFLVKTSVPKTSYAKVIDGISTSRKRNRAGLININTAPRQVLLAMGGLQTGDVENLIGKRTSADTTNIAWVLDAVAPTTAVAIGGAITARSFQYSADIVGVSGDGRAHRRARIVVDATTLPAKIIYRKDLTSLGWPLPPEIRDTLRSGNQLPPTFGGISTTGNH